jgi:hypothetical protein
MMEEIEKEVVEDVLKHSELGIASFIISLIAGIALMVIVFSAGIIEATTPGGMDESSLQAVLIGLSMYIFIGLAMVALGLGLAGLVQKGHRKIFALLGTIFSVVAIINTLLILFVGLLSA